jgi:putative sigma-54 modulation protein
MRVKINSVHFKADKRLEDFISDKVGKLENYFEGVISSEVTLKISKNETTGNKVAEIRVNLPGTDLFAKKQAPSFEQAADIAVEALKKQITRHKEKVRGL